MVLLLARLHAFAALEVVASRINSTRSCADTTPACLNSVRKVLEALAEILLRHFQVANVRLLR